MINKFNRTRRLRSSAAIRNLVSEFEPKLNKVIEPLFLLDPEASQTTEPIETMPGIQRRQLPETMQYIQSQQAQGICNFVLFPVVPDKLKDAKASYALDKNNFYLNAITEIKDKFPECSIMTDVALDPYSSDGHDGIVKNGKILNDETLPILSEMALLQAAAGADIIGPSDMMDGRIIAIRSALDESGFENVCIMSYCAKFASSFYGPFREALDSAPKAGDKKTYQMDYRNSKQAKLELKFDEIEQADIIMVKPALAYLDIIKDLSSSTSLPVAAYQVSGEYASLMFAAQHGAIDINAAVLESTTAIHRAGADIILTYFAASLANLLNS